MKRLGITRSQWKAHPCASSDSTFINFRRFGRRRSLLTARAELARQLVKTGLERVDSAKLVAQIECGF